MTKAEAIEVLNEAPTEDIASHLNPQITQRHAVEVVRRSVESQQDGDLPGWLERRVNQVRNPKYKK